MSCFGTPSIITICFHGVIVSDVPKKGPNSPSRKSMGRGVTLIRDFHIATFYIFDNHPIKNLVKAQGRTRGVAVIIDFSPSVKRVE